MDGKEKENQSGLCDSSVVQHSGYLRSSPDAYYFYWFFESQTDPSNAPLTIWLNGGPGCSSMVGLWQELGPCKLGPNGEHTINNPYSWNKYSNPAGAGFSFGEDDVNSSRSGAKPAYDFIVNFLKRYPKYAKLPLHFFGESYAGHYIPVYADYILQQNHLVKTGRLDNPIIQLQTIGIGNGWTNSLIQMEQYPTMACNSSYGALISEGTCNRMRANLPRCLERIRRCHSTDLDRDCSLADSYCNKHVVSLFDQAKRSYYDVRTVSSPPPTYRDYLNRNTTKGLIGAVGTYHECSDEVFDRFFLTGDGIRNTDTQVAGLLDNGIKVLIYAGDADYICSWYGNYAWLEELAFNGREDYQSQSMQPWMVDGIEAGQIQSGGNLTFIRVYEAGHEVPYYQPKAAQSMFYDHIH
ncbi:Alpha/Beta hydrolase protein [Absidia repens]|uniref:Alpha/Beta hydrolase protein n=1 Tax=Absidia repens TaxID=90262 RepID=A0A1X2IYF6_9FUNG|nr:Alpha/Beta hydrolase protein [Absidia repens]